MPVNPSNNRIRPSLARSSESNTVAPKPAESSTDALLTRVGRPAMKRIFSADANPSEPMIGRGTGKKLNIERPNSDTERWAISASGRFLLNGKLANQEPGRGADGAMTYALAKQCEEQNGVFDKLSLSSAMRGRILGQLAQSVQYSQSGKASQHKAKTLSGAYCLLIDLARNTPKSDTTVRRAVIDQILQTLHRDPNKEQVGFYLQSMRKLFGRLDKTQSTALKEILQRILPKRPLVEEYTAGRTKPLEIRHMIHEEFWKEELSFFTKERGFKLVKKNAKDTKREYVGTIKHPSGRKKPLKINIKIEKGELDFLKSMSDPDVHLIMYSGHSALGGNGAQSIDEAEAAQGKHPKLVFIANCRGKDNYADFTNKFPDAHCIMTEHPTYGVSGQDRIEGLFDTLVRGNTYRYMRSVTEYEWWDEPADNYFYPDEWRKYRFMDSDSDGRVDRSAKTSDRLYDIDSKETGEKFMRAINFANSEIYYHWEVAHDNGKKSFFGRKYGDSLVPNGPIKNPKEGETLRITPVHKKTSAGKKSVRYRVQYNPKIAAKTDENHFCAMVTMETAIALAKDKTGKTTAHDVLRGVLMGAQAIHYMDIYSNTNPITMRKYFKDLGIASNVKAADIDNIFETYDAHANKPQIKAFKELLQNEYDVDLDAWAKQWIENNTD